MNSGPFGNVRLPVGLKDNPVIQDPDGYYAWVGIVTFAHHVTGDVNLSAVRFTLNNRLAKKRQISGDRWRRQVDKFVACGMLVDPRRDGNQLCATVNHFGELYQDDGDSYEQEAKAFSETGLATSFSEEARELKAPVKGYVYLIRCVTDDDKRRCKVGASTNPQARLRTLQTGNPFSLELVHTFPSDDMYASEFAMHKKFGDKRLGDEWYLLEADHIEAFAAVLSWERGAFVFRVAPGGASLEN